MQLIRVINEGKCKCCNKENAVLKIKIKQGIKSFNISLCNNCAKIIYFELGKMVIPKSPINILNKEKINENK